jgi:threonine dehydrogenase-like Zn-dependent dehydrogenase
MKAQYYELTAPQLLTLPELELDTSRLGADKILATTQFSVVSPGTELAAWQGQPPLRPSKVYPRLVGYCNLARVAAIGSGVRDIAVGDCVLTHQSHRTAFVCPAAEILLTFPATTAPTLCRRLAATYLYHLGQVALQAGGFTTDKRVAIIGRGTLGVATAELVCAQGGQPFVFTDQTAVLPTLGLEHVFPKSAASQQSTADIVINTTNLWADHLLALQLAKHRARIVCLGFPGRSQPLPDFNPLDSQYFYDKQLSLHHCGHVPDHATLQHNLAHLADLITGGQLNPDLLLSVDAPWSDLAAIYARLAAREPGLLTACLRWTP